MVVTDGLQLDLHPREYSAVLQLTGDLDLATAGRLRAALGWLRRRYRGMLVVDTERLDFIDLTGYRALMDGLRGAEGQSDSRVVHVEGAAVTRLRSHLAAARRAHPSDPGSHRSVTGAATCG